VVLAPTVDEAYADEARAAGVTTVELPVRRWPRPLRGFALSGQIARRRASLDVLIAVNRIRGADIAVCGGTHRGYLEASGRRMGWKDRLQISREDRLYEDAGVIVAHSTFMQRELERLYDVAGKVVTVYPPVDTQRFTPVDDAKRAELRRRFGFGHRPVFLFASTGHQRKGLDAVLAAVERAGHDALLVVAGRPTQRRSAVLHDLGYRDDMPDLYRAVDFTVLAPDYEPFGLVGIESILCGTPLIFADGVGALEVVAQDAARRFDRSSSASLDAALADALRAFRAGTSRLADPATHLLYTPDLATHVEAMSVLCRRLCHR